MIDVSRSGHYVGDCRDLLKQLPDRCAQTCVTSPPYWGLRDYGTSRWDGGNASCDHRESTPSRTSASVASSTLGGSKDTVHGSHVFRGNCGRCGAVRVDLQIGLERSPIEYVASIVDVFRSVRRVLRDDGTLWLNLGDSYSGSGKGPSNNSTKPKDLVGIPWRVAFALQADGWYLRSDIIWHKPNPMPESVTDRPTKAHEYVFLLSKSERYFYDHEAIAEPASHPEGPGNKQGNKHEAAYHAGDNLLRTRANLSKIGARETRNKRSVWTIATQPYDGAHFATMPPPLAETCILAGSKPGDIVLDPFFGSGTTGMVAEKHGRRWIGFDLNPEYEQLQKERTAQRSLALGGKP